MRLTSPIPRSVGSAVGLMALGLVLLLGASAGGDSEAWAKRAPRGDTVGRAAKRRNGDRAERRKARRARRARERETSKTVEPADEQPPVQETFTPAPRAASRGDDAVRGRAPNPEQREVVIRESKIEFDERLVQGQTASGAIYLFQRAESEFKSLVKVPRSFRRRTVRKVFPKQP